MGTYVNLWDRLWAFCVLWACKNSKKYLLQSFLLGSSKKYIDKLKGEIWINNQYANQVSFVFIVPIEKSLVEESSNK